MPRNAPGIPLDVVLDILRRLEDLADWNTLARCALTCRLWYPEVLKIMSSRVIAQSLNPRALATNKWIQWCGTLMWKPPLHLSYVVRLEISCDDWDDKGRINHSWLHSALVALPRLQYLFMKLYSLRDFHPGFTPPTPLRPLEVVRIEGYNRLLQPKDALNLLQYFANTKSITLKTLRVIASGSGENAPANCDITPHSVYICGGGPTYLRPWIKLFSRSAAAHAIRRLRLAFREYLLLHRTGCVGFLRSLTHLEAIEFDFFTVHSYQASTSIGIPCRLIKEELGPAFPDTLHTLCLRLPKEPWQKCEHRDVCLSLLKAVPDTLRHVEVRASDCNKYFGAESFARSLERLPGLQTLHVVLDEKEVIEKSVEEIAEYRTFLYNGFPELAARGALRLASEIRTVWQDTA